MTKREAFIKIVEEMFNRADTYAENYPNEFELAATFWEDFKNNKPKSSNAVTENGAKILAWMQENEANKSNLFISKEIAEGIFSSGRSVAGSMRKLAADGYIQKTGENPVQYSLTDLGRSFS